MISSCRNFALLLTAILSMAMVPPLIAGTETSTALETNTASYWNGTYLTGDWGGTRPRLENDGIKPYLIYTSILAADVSGGVRQGGPEYAQDINPGCTFDLGKLVGWQGATINLNGVERIGKTIRPDVGSVYDPVQIYGGQTYTLYNVTLEQKFCGDFGSFKIGRLSPGDDFAESPLYNYYVNNGIDGQIRAVIDDTRFNTYPFPTWGARLLLNPSPEFNLQTGVFEVNDHLTDRSLHGVDFAISGNDGIQVVQQFGWTPTFDRESAGAPSTGLPGHYFLGGYWSNSNYPQFGTPVLTRISYGFYAHADQRVYRPTPGSDTGLTLFGTAAYAPQPNVAILPFQLSGGALYQGLVPGRAHDTTILGVIYGNFSEDYSDSIEPTIGGRPSNEIDFELGYRVQVSPFAYFQPDLQYIEKPGGTGNIPNAFIVGAQFGLTF
jgi:porin